MADINAIAAEYNQLYNPQIDVIKQRQKLLGQSFAPKLEAINQAKKNAYRKFDVETNDRGLFYSGAPIEKQAQYIGETYTPQVAALGTEEAQGRLGLAGELYKLLAERGQNIFSRFDTQTARELEAQLKREELAQRERLGGAEVNALLQRARI